MTKFIRISKKIIGPIDAGHYLDNQIYDLTLELYDMKKMEINPMYHTSNPEPVCYEVVIEAEKSVDDD